MPTRYYPQHKDARVNEDFRILYDHMYQQQDAAAATAAKPAPPPAPSTPDAGSPSHTKIAGLNVKATPPTSGNNVTTLSGVPVLGYNSKTGQWETYIPT